MDIRQAPMEAMNHREKLSGICGCYSCLAQFNVQEITEWTDNDRTALCPKCKKDCVLSNINAVLLKKAQKYWF